MFCQGGSPGVSPHQKNPGLSVKSVTGFPLAANRIGGEGRGEVVRFRFQV
jgi:hypothetical protein